VLAPPRGAEINFRGSWEGHICGGKGICLSSLCPYTNQVLANGRGCLSA